MRLSELLEEQEPLLFSMMRKAKAAGKKIAWYIRSGDSTKPVWIHSWKHDQLAPSPGETDALPFWQLTGYQGYRVMYRNLLDADLDKWTLVAGKTKGTLQLKRRAVTNTNEGVGSYAMDFSYYMENNFPDGDKKRAAVKAFGIYLLKKGYSFTESQHGGAAFIKGTLPEGKVRILMPRKADGRSSPTKGKILLTYFCHMTGTPVSKSQPLSIMTRPKAMIAAHDTFEKTVLTPT
jgi:hypothetical protein